MNTDLLTKIRLLIYNHYSLKITIVEHYEEYQYYIIDINKDKMIYSSIDNDLTFSNEDKCIFDAINWIIMNIPSTGK